ncbi:MAG: hypothetical protein M1833_005137 [Piccolia ochrophora]|nr:MAG: hypothetical protein M1833_005137 [Piccolia ochrophora]
MPDDDAAGSAEHPYWRNRRLTPAQLHVRDVRVDVSRPSGGPILYLDDDPDVTIDPYLLEAEERNGTDWFGPIEQGELSSWEESKIQQGVKQYGWMRRLRMQEHRRPPNWNCRWIHISSLFPEYLRGVLLALVEDQACAIRTWRALEHCISQNERFSKHGRYFPPISEHLDAEASDASDTVNVTPLLVCFPFMDWTTYPEAPPAARFQVDPHGQFQSTRSALHPIRSMLQYFYRLEDTRDRERDQVFTKHRPWTSDSFLHSKVQRWYGQTPTGLSVDEMWILVVDEHHIVTFCSNQTWKPRFPPHQVSYRIAEIAFRGLRNRFRGPGKPQRYNALTHLVACVSGSIGLLHRSFWADIMFCLTDRIGGYLSHLQYRLHRSPSTSLVVQLLQIQDELNITIDITRAQWNLVTDLRSRIQDCVSEAHRSSNVASGGQDTQRSIDAAPIKAEFNQRQVIAAKSIPYSVRDLPDVLSQLLANLDREFSDLRNLRDNCDNLVTRTVQLVNIRLEDHGKAILVFTIVTVVFLPLSFVSSFFGMNTVDIRTMRGTQALFWAMAMGLTTLVVGATSFVAFFGLPILERLMEWRERRRIAAERQREQNIQRRLLQANTVQGEGFRVLGAAKQTR